MSGYGTLLAFAIALTLVSLMMGMSAVVRYVESEEKPWWLSPATALFFIVGVTLIGFAASELAA